MRRAHTLVELVVTGSIGLVMVAGLTGLWTSSRKSEAVASQHLDAQEGAMLALQQLRLDLRQISFVPGKPVQDYSLRIAPDHRSVRLRRTAPSWPGKPPGSAFTVVEYGLESAVAPRMKLVRKQWTASGTTLPARATSREEIVLRQTHVLDFCVLYAEDEPKDTRVLHVALEVTSGEGAIDTGRAGAAPKLLVTSVFQLPRPEAAYGGPLPLFAEPLPAAVDAVAEIPPGPVLAPAAVDAVPLPL